MAIPLSHDEVDDFSPASLKNVQPQPTFRLRPATVRDHRRFLHAIGVEGLQHHDQEAVRAEVVKAMKALYTEGTFETQLDRLNSLWASLDQNVPLQVEDLRAMTDLMDRLAREWRPLRMMLADNIRFHQDAPKIALGLYLAGLKNLDVTFRIDNGWVPLEVLDAIEDALDALEEQAVIDKVEGVIPGLAFKELSAHVLRRLRLTKEEEKNSDGPSLPSSSPNGSTTTAAPGSSTRKSRKSKR